MRLPPCMMLICALTLSACAAKHPAEIRQTPPPAAVTQRLEGPDGTLTFTRIGHAAVLIQSGDKAILADPWFTTTRVYHQGEALAYGVESLPPLTAILASHGHYDHYDVESLGAIQNRAVPFLVRVETGDDARKAGFTDVREMDHWDTAEVGGVKITATPAKHEVPENTYVIQMDGFTVFFGGDSLNIPEFQQVHERFPDVDLAILSVNGLTLFGKKQVVSNPDDAAKIAGLLGAKAAVPMHYRYHGNWFREAFIYDHPGTPEEFVAAAKTEAPYTRTYILETGQPLVLQRAPAQTATP